VSADELDVVVDTALENGALGARMTGGGFGGSAIALLPTDSVDPVAAAVASAFEERGWQPPGLLTATPSPGARRTR
jgi:galactokinase